MNRVIRIGLTTDRELRVSRIGPEIELRIWLRGSHSTDPDDFRRSAAGWGIPAELWPSVRNALDVLTRDAA